MSFVLLIGILGVIVFLLLFFKRPIIGLVGRNDEVVQKLKQVEWFQNHWKGGAFLFLINAILFTTTYLVLSLLVYFTIAFVHLIVMFLAVMGSIFSWSIIQQSWKGTKTNRMKLAIVGSSFYAFLALLFVFQLVTLKPSFPGDDTFMAAVGYVLGIIVTTVAFLTCLIFTSFSTRSECK